MPPHEACDAAAGRGRIAQLLRARVLLTTAVIAVAGAPSLTAGLAAAGFALSGPLGS